MGFNLTRLVDSALKRNPVRDFVEQNDVLLPSATPGHPGEKDHLSSLSSMLLTQGHSVSSYDGALPEAVFKEFNIDRWPHGVVTKERLDGLVQHWRTQIARSREAFEKGEVSCAVPDSLELRAQCLDVEREKRRVLGVLEDIVENHLVKLQGLMEERELEQVKVVYWADEVGQPGGEAPPPVEDGRSGRDWGDIAKTTVTAMLIHSFVTHSMKKK